MGFGVGHRTPKVKRQPAGYVPCHAALRLKWDTLAISSHVRAMSDSNPTRITQGGPDLLASDARLTDLHLRTPQMPNTRGLMPRPKISADSTART